MKTSMRLLLASAAFFFAIASQCLAASEVTMDLTGQVLKSGSTLKVSSGTATIDHAVIYTYAISGTVTGTGRLQLLTGAGGISLEDLFNKVDPALTPYLSGTVVDVSDRFPYTCGNVVKSGSFAFSLATIEPSLTGSGYIFGTAGLKAGISTSGECYGQIATTRFGVRIPPLPTLTDKTDTLTFTSGQVVVSTYPSGGPPQPNLSFVYGHTLIYADVTGTNGEDQGLLKPVHPGGSTGSEGVVLENAGSMPDSYTITDTAVSSPFSQVVIYKGVNITRKVTGSGFVTPTIPPGGVITLIWEIKSTKTFGGEGSSALTATSNTNGAQDTLGLYLYEY